jgi:chemotaxis protein CheX
MSMGSRMPATPLITDALIQDSIVLAVQNVSRTMLKQEAVVIPTPRTALASLGAPPFVAGCVGFGGDIDGLVYLCLTESAAAQIARQVLGMTEAEVKQHSPEILKDVVGEITNMTTGAFKTALNQAGLPCKLTLPTFLRGDHLSIAAIKSARQFTFHFSCGAYRILADVQVRM